MCKFFISGCIQPLIFVAKCCKVQKYLLKLKAFHRIATRHDKLACTYLNFLCIASIMVWNKMTKWNNFSNTFYLSLSLLVSSLSHFNFKGQIHWTFRCHYIEYFYSPLSKSLFSIPRTLSMTYAIFLMSYRTPDWLLNVYEKHFSFHVLHTQPDNLYICREWYHNMSDSFLVILSCYFLNFDELSAYLLDICPRCTKSFPATDLPITYAVFFSNYVMKHILNSFLWIICFIDLLDN